MPVLAYLFLVGFMTLQPGAELLNQGGGRGFFLKKALALISFIALFVADFDVVECGKPTKSTYVPHLPFAFVRFSSSQLQGLGQTPVAELYANGRKVTWDPLKSWDSNVSPGLGGYTMGNKFNGFAIDRDQLNSGSVKTQLAEGGCYGLRMEVHPSGSEHPRLVAYLDYASVSWEDAGNQNYYLHIDMRGKTVEYKEGGSRRGEVVRGRDSAETSINMDSYSSGSGYGIHSQSGGSRSSSSGSSTRGGVALSGGRQWAGTSSTWRGYRR